MKLLLAFANRIHPMVGHRFRVDMVRPNQVRLALLYRLCHLFDHACLHIEWWKIFYVFLFAEFWLNQKTKKLTYRAKIAFFVNKMKQVKKAKKKIALNQKKF